MKVEQNKKNTGVNASLLNVFQGFISFFEHIALGAYYLFYYVFVVPINYIFKGLEDIYYQIFTPNTVKKDKELKLNVNFDSDGNEIKKESKDISSQMKNNKNMLLRSNKSKPQKALSEQQKNSLKLERDSLLKMINTGNDSRLDKPQTFKYKAMDPDGRIVKDTFVGVSKLDIYTFLTGEGYTVYSIETSPLINFMYGESTVINKKLSTKDLIFFITQLATYIKSGITLTEAVRILAKQMNKNKNMHKILQSIVYYLTMGEAFSSALEKQNGVFPNLVINMIKAAEAAGNIDEALDDLGNYYTELNKTHKQMISAISYPSFIAFFSVGVTVFIMLKIVPQFVSIYETAGAEITGLTKFVIDTSNFLQDYILVILLIVVIIVFTIIMAYKNIKPFKISVQVFLMKLPIIGPMIIYSEITIFTKTFASLLKNDVFITDSISILSNLTNNEIYKEIMLNTITNIARGEKISESFKNQWAIPDIAYYMIVTGENTGQLATMMAKVSDYYQEQHSTVVNSLKSLIEPIMIIFLAVIVGGILIATILPIFNLYNNLGV